MDVIRIKTWSAKELVLEMEEWAEIGYELIDLPWFEEGFLHTCWFARMKRENCVDVELKFTIGPVSNRKV